MQVSDLGVTRDSQQLPQVGVGIVVWRGDEVLLVKRGTEPRAGQWSLPGGRQRLGETVRDAALRELTEETGLTVTLPKLLDVVDSITPGLAGGIRYHYTLVVYDSEWQAGEARAGDDAADLCWVTIDRLGTLEMWDETKRIIRLAAARRQAAE